MDFFILFEFPEVLFLHSHQHQGALLGPVGSVPGEEHTSVQMCVLTPELCGWLNLLGVSCCLTVELFHWFSHSYGLQAKYPLMLEPHFVTQERLKLSTKSLQSLVFDVALNFSLFVPSPCQIAVHVLTLSNREGAIIQISFAFICFILPITTLKCFLPQLPLFLRPLVETELHLSCTSWGFCFLV